MLDLFIFHPLSKIQINFNQGRSPQAQELNMIETDRAQSPKAARPLISPSLHALETMSSGVAIFKSCAKPGARVGNCMELHH